MLYPKNTNKGLKYILEEKAVNKSKIINTKTIVSKSFILNATKK